MADIEGKNCRRNVGRKKKRTKPNPPNLVGVSSLAALLSERQ